MPSPVFLWEGACGGAEPLPYAPMMDFCRAACPHTAAKGGQGVRPYRWIWGRCNRADVGSELSAASGG